MVPISSLLILLFISLISGLLVGIFSGDASRIWIQFSGSVTIGVMIFCLVCWLHGR